MILNETYCGRKVRKGTSGFKLAFALCRSSYITAAHKCLIKVYNPSRCWTVCSISSVCKSIEATFYNMGPLLKLCPVTYDSIVMFSVYKPEQSWWGTRAKKTLAMKRSLQATFCILLVSPCFRLKWPVQKTPLFLGQEIPTWSKIEEIERELDKVFHQHHYLHYL